MVSIPPVVVIVLLIWQLTRWRFDAVPVVTRLARVIWMHADQHFDPE